MKILKNITILLMVLSFFGVTFAEKRVNPKSQAELTDPSSPSYVPHPYPKNRKEIIADLKYAINRLFVDKESVSISGKTPAILEILTGLLDQNSVYHIGHIVKVKNRVHRMAHDYTWLICIMNGKNEIAARVSMRATGLFGSFVVIGNAVEKFRRAFPNSRFGPHYLLMEDDVIEGLSQALNQTFSVEDIKKIERVAFQSSLGGLLYPVWEIKLKKSGLYYYSIRRQAIYEVDKKIPWEKDNRGVRKGLRKLTQSMDVLPDSINDEIIVLKKLKTIK